MKLPFILLSAFTLLLSSITTAAPDPDNVKYAKLFIDLYTTLKKPANGYFSPEGVPYHSVETMICEAPDYGHETTSESYSYWLWLEGMFGFMSNQWNGVKEVWDNAEKYIIPTTAYQPTNSFYKAENPATYMPECDLPSEFPAPMDKSKQAGQDPLFPELRSAYGTPEIYGMHWLLDVDNWYGYGNMNDGTSKPSYINTFQRGFQESVWETVPHPSWEAFKFGGTNGYLNLFVQDATYAQQWRYTNAPDADARMVQAMYWCYLWALEKKQDAKSVLPVDKAAKMGDYLRYCMFDKYFRAIPNTNGDYPNAHYLISWYYAWGGAVDPLKGWAFRIGCSHNHFGYQNPVAAYALGTVADFKPKSPNGQRDWKKSYERQFEFYQWLQSADGAIGGGATSSWHGQYLTPPAGNPTFYGMTYDEAPVYGDPPSNSWYGWQAWSMQRMGEIFFLTGDKRVEKIMDKWIAWVKKSVKLNADGTFEIPSEIAWDGMPDTWTGYDAFTGNPNYHVIIKGYSTDLGITASTARALIHYSAAKKKHSGAPDAEAMRIAKELIDRIVVLYKDSKGYAAPEERGDYSRFFSQEVFIPAAYSGKMPNGDEIKPGVKFIDIRSKYKNDPDFARVKAAVDAGQKPVMRYHRFWAQVEIALAFAEYARFSQPNPNVAPIEVNADSIKAISLPVQNTPTTASVKKYAVHSTAGHLVLSGLKGNESVELSTMNGRSVLRAKANNQSSLFLSTGRVPCGMYLLTVTGKDSRFSSKLMIDRK
jgi:hypothetical protein